MTKKWMSIKPGDQLCFVSPTKEKMLKRVKKIEYYPANNQGFNPLICYLFKETLEKTLPGINDIEGGKKIYLQWSTQEEINKYGFMGIHIY